MASSRIATVRWYAMGIPTHQAAKRLDFVVPALAFSNPDNYVNLEDHLQSLITAGIPFSVTFQPVVHPIQTTPDHIARMAFRETGVMF